MNVRTCGLCGSTLEDDDVHWCYECFLENATPGSGPNDLTVRSSPDELMAEIFRLRQENIDLSEALSLKTCKTTKIVV